MSNWSEQGCELCRQGVLSSEWSPEVVTRFGGKTLPPRHVLTSLEQHAALHYCDCCGAWWEFGERTASVIDEAEARRLFPAHFEG